MHVYSHTHTSDAFLDVSVWKTLLGHSVIQERAWNYPVAVVAAVAFPRAWALASGQELICVSEGSDSKPISLAKRQ